MIDSPKYRFFAPSSSFNGSRVELPESEARHAARVLRLAPGTDVTVVDGRGKTHVVRLDDVTKRTVSGVILSTELDVGESDRRLSVALSVLKNRNRFETFLEKSVELGVDRIVPVISSRTEKKGMKRPRAESILISALKQSGRSRLPDLADPRPLMEEIDEFSVSRALGTSLSAKQGPTAPESSSAEQGAAAEREPGAERIGLICHEGARDHDHIFETILERDADVDVLIGPEGGFTDTEVGAAVSAGYRLVWMGPRRLRAETAALTAAGILRMKMDYERP